MKHVLCWVQPRIRNNLLEFSGKEKFLIQKLKELDIETITGAKEGIKSAQDISIIPVKKSIFKTVSSYIKENIKPEILITIEKNLSKIAKWVDWDIVYLPLNLEYLSLLTEHKLYKKVGINIPFMLVFMVNEKRVYVPDRRTFTITHSLLNSALSIIKSEGVYGL